MEIDSVKLLSPPAEVKKWVQGGMVAIRFTWNVEGEGNRLCSLDFGFDVQQWDNWLVDHRKHMFLTEVANIPNRGLPEAPAIPAHLHDQLMRDCRDFADAYDWDTDRKVKFQQEV